MELGSLLLLLLFGCVVLCWWCLAWGNVAFCLAGLVVALRRRRRSLRLDQRVLFVAEQSIDALDDVALVNAKSCWLWLFELVLSAS